MFEISLQVLPLVEYCHMTTLPVLPERVSSVLLVPEHTSVPPETEPPTVAGSTVISAGVAYSGSHTPLWICALNRVVAVKPPEVYVFAVLEMLVQVLKGDSELCHFKMAPVFPDRVSSPVVPPEQMVVLPAIVPPMEVGYTVTVAADELAASHAPL